LRHLSLEGARLRASREAIVRYAYYSCWREAEAEAGDRLLVLA